MYSMPYRGQPTKKQPKTRKPKRILTPKEKQRDNIVWALIILFSLVFTACLAYVMSGAQPEEMWKIALYVLGIFLLIFGLNAGTEALNKHLRADELDKPKEPDKEQEE